MHVQFVYTAHFLLMVGRKRRKVFQCRTGKINIFLRFADLGGVKFNCDVYCPQRRDDPDFLLTLN